MHLTVRTKRDQGRGSHPEADAGRGKVDLHRLRPKYRNTREKKIPQMSNKWQEHKHCFTAIIQVDLH